MPAPITQTIPLKQCVFSYSEASKQSDAEFRRLWRMAFRGFKQMGINAFWQPRTWVLTVNSNKTADIPPECFQWIKIGQFNASGELQTLRVNEQLTTFHDGLSTRLNDIPPQIQDASPDLLSDFWFNGWDVWGGYNPTYPSVPFGAGSRMIQFGECIVDWKQRIIILDTNYQYTEVVLEGMETPEMNDDYEIPLVFEEAMIAWLALQDILYLPATSHMNNNNVEMRRQMFKSQLALAKKMYKPIRLQEVYQEAVEAYNLGVKP